MSPWKTGASSATERSGERYVESVFRKLSETNRTAGLSIMAAALGAAFFLSLLCSLFYNLWAYDVEAIKLDEGSWHVVLRRP